MNETEMSQYILDTFKGVDSVQAMDAYFFFYNPNPDVPPDHTFPFATIVTNDLHDQFSDLNRSSVFRLNMGIGKETFLSMFDKFKPSENAADNSEYDFTALDQVLPHPVYGQMYWVCILNPSDETFQSKVLPLLNEAYQIAVSKYERKSAHK